MRRMYKVLRDLISRIKTNLDLLYPFVLTVAVTLLAFYWAGVYPFGSTAALREDGIFQYVGYYGWFSRVLHGEASLDYSFSKSLGGSTFGLFSYYLSSPFNLLFGCFEPSEAAKVVSLVYVLKVGFCSSSCFFFLKQRFGAQGFFGVLLSSFYGLSACNFVSGSNLMWLDGQIMLPIICLSVWQSVNGRHKAFLPISVGLAIIFNWYSAYMCVVFSILWLVFELIDSEHIRTSRDVLHALLNYCFQMILGAMVSALILLPTAYCQVISSRGATPTPVTGDFFTTSLFDVLHKNFIGFSSITGSALIDDYFACSLVVIFVLYYFLFVSDNRATKLTLFGLLAIVLTCERSPYLSLLWTGFSRADSFNPRYHFCFLLVMIVCAYKTVAKKDNQSNLNLRCRRVIFCCALYVAEELVMNYILPYDRQKYFLLQVLLVIVSTLSIVGLLSTRDCHFNLHPAGLFILLCVFVIECTVPIKLAFKDDTSTSKLNVYEYSEYIRQLESASNSAHSFARSERLGFSTRGYASTTFPSGENLAVGIDGIGHYSSAGSQALKTTLGSLGYCGIDGVRGIVYYNSPLEFADQLLGISTIYSSKDYAIPMAFEEEEISSDGQISMWRYQNPLSLGFQIQGQLDSEWASENPFKSQQKLGESLSGVHASLYQNEGFSLSAYENHLIAHVLISKEGPLYLKVGPSINAEVSCDGKLLQKVNNWEFTSNVIYLGSFEVGQDVTVDLTLPSSEELSSSDSFLALETKYKEGLDFQTLDETVASSMLAQMNDNPLRVDSISDGVVNGSISVDQDSLIFLSIPYEEGWSAKVNDQPAQIVDDGGFMALQVRKGSNSIQLRYTTPGKTVGLIVSCVGVAALFLYSYCFDSIRHLAKFRFRTK